MKKLDLHFPDDSFSELQLGEPVLLSGTIYTLRDAGLKRLQKYLEVGKELPMDLQGKFLYFCGPSPAPQGKIIGSCGPTTSDRMEPYLEMMFRELGIKGCLGKGGFSPQGNRIFQKYKRIYFAVTGGIGAFLAQKVKAARIVAFEDLGPEALFELTVEGFPMTFAVDSAGRTIFTHE